MRQMGFFARFALQKRISAAEKSTQEIGSRLDLLEDDLRRLLESRRKDRARAMANLRWETTARNGASVAGTRRATDPVSQRIIDQRARSHRSLAELAGEPVRRDEEEE